MKLKSSVDVVLGIIVLAGGACLLTGCQTSQTSDAKTGKPAAVAPPPVKMEPRALVEGGKAYVRIKEYGATPQKEWAPKGGEATLAFGEAVTLVKKKEKDGPNNIFWLTSRDAAPQVWIPAYLLTSSQLEISSLRDKGRIPETMSFFYETKVGEATHLAGAAHILPFVTNSEGMPASNQGSDQVAIKGNAVVFDPSVVTHKWGTPMIFSNGSKTWEISSNLMCHCTSVDETQGKGGCVPSSGLVDTCPGGVGARPKGTFDCVEVAGEPVQ